MKKIILCSVVFIVVFLQGCANLHTNLSSRNISETPLPVIGTVQYDSSVVYLVITSIDAKPLGRIWSANVDPGTHEVAYACNAGPVTGSGKVTIEVSPGMSYLLKSRSFGGNPNRSLTDAVGGRSYERDRIKSIMDRTLTDNAGTGQAATKTCEAEVLVCKGYPYMGRNQERLKCLDEPIGKIKNLITDDNYMRLF